MTKTIKHEPMRIAGKKVDAEKNIIYVGEEEYLNSTIIKLEDCNWIGGDKDTNDIKVRIRSSHHEVNAKVELLPNNEALVTLRNPEKAIAPGQACVFYDDQQVLGGGWIKK